MITFTKFEEFGVVGFSGSSKGVVVAEPDTLTVQPVPGLVMTAR